MRLSVLHVLDERFPGQGAILRRLLEHDHELRAVCEDFAVSLAAVAHWRQSGAPDGESRVAEYRQLAEELAQEIEGMLERRK